MEWGGTDKDIGFLHIVRMLLNGQKLNYLINEYLPMKNETTSSSIKLATNGSVGILKIEIPPINAFDENALNDLMKAIHEIENNETIKVLIIISGIKDIFCAGGDLKYWPRTYPDRPGFISETGCNVFTKIENLKKPTMAAIQGQVIGDGLSLILACDIRLASNNSTFSLPEVGYGFIPGWGTIGRLLDVVGKTVTAEMLFSGEKINAVRAQKIGLINQIKDPASLIPSAYSLSEKIAAKPPMTLSHAKAALLGDPTRKRQCQKAFELNCFISAWGDNEWKAGINRLFNIESGAVEKECLNPTNHMRNMLEI